MVFIIISAILLMWITKREFGWDWGVIILNGFFGAILGVVIAAFVSLPLYQPEMVETTYEQELVAISDTAYPNTSSRGRFWTFYISTTLDGGYSYYVKEGDGFKMSTASADSSTIKYTDGTPKIVTTDATCKNGFVVTPLYFSMACPSSTTHTFYVPEGSIKSSYELGV